MAQYHSVPDAKKMVTCPFNISHSIEEARMPYHLLKCAKNYPDLRIEVCPFNSKHMFTKKHEYEHHLMLCADSVIVARERIEQLNKNENCSRTELYCSDNMQSRQVESSEDWDLEVGDSRKAGYDPQQRLSKLELKNPVVLANRKPSEKKAYHLNVSSENEMKEAEKTAPPVRPEILIDRPSTSDIENFRLPIGPPAMIRERDDVLRSRAGLGSGRPTIAREDAAASHIKLVAVARGRGTSIVKPPPGFAL